MPPQLPGALSEKMLQLGIAHLRKFAVPFADGKEKVRGCETNHFVGYLAQAGAGLTGAHRHSDNHTRRLQQTHVLDSGGHSAACGQAIIDEDRGAVTDIDCGFAVAIRGFAPNDLSLFARNDFCDVGSRDAKVMDHRLVDHLGIGGYGAEGHFRLPGDAEFPDDDDIEGQAQPIGDGKTHWNSAPGERQHNSIVLVLNSASGAKRKLGRQAAARLNAIGIRKMRHFNPPWNLGTAVHQSD
jgi:hypothetical protein